MDQFIEFENHKIFYRMFGNGHPVVFLHGFLEDGSIWDTIYPNLVEEYSVLIVDLPGHGKSECRLKECSMAFMALAVEHILLDLKLKKPIIFGHSMGGYVGLELIKRIDAKLVLVHSNFWADGPQKQLDRDRVIDVVEHSKTLFIKQAIPNLFFKANIKGNSGQIDYLIKQANRISVSSIKAATKGMRNRLDNTALLEQNRIEIIQGENDPIITQNMMTKQLKESGANINLKVIKKCGHMGFIEQPKHFLTLVLNLCLQAKNEIISNK